MIDSRHRRSNYATLVEMSPKGDDGVASFYRPSGDLGQKGLVCHVGQGVDHDDFSLALLQHFL
jgi:hypothetical protein